MIKLLSLLLSVTFANGQNFVYLLPDEGAVFETWLHSRIKKSTLPIFIATPSMHYPPLHKSIISHQSHGADLTLIVNTLQKDPLRVIQYQNTYLYHYEARKLHGTLLILDPYVCQITAPLDKELLNTAATTVFCSDDPQTLASAKKAFTLLQKRSSLYLK